MRLSVVVSEVSLFLNFLHTLVLQGLVFFSFFIIMRSMLSCINVVFYLDQHNSEVASNIKELTSSESEAALVQPLDGSY